MGAVKRFVSRGGPRLHGLCTTELAEVTCGTIRTKLLKIGAVVTVSVRRLRVALSSMYPMQQVFERVLANVVEEYPLRT